MNRDDRASNWSEVNRVFQSGVLPKINGGIQFVKINYRSGQEPEDGLISYSSELLYFAEHGDYHEGVRYIVYKNNSPAFWFTLSYPYVNPDNGFPVHDPEELINDDRDFEDGSFKVWHSSDNAPSF